MRILVVEDEKRMADLIKRGLEENGHTAAVAYDGIDGLRMAESYAFDAIVLDVMLPGQDGFGVLKTLRAHKVAVPVLMLTARDSVTDKVAGLDLGADDYLTKPFDLPELEARVRALIRRGQSGGIAENILRQQLMQKRRLHTVQPEATLQMRGQGARPAWASDFGGHELAASLGQQVDVNHRPTILGNAIPNRTGRRIHEAAFHPRLGDDELALLVEALAVRQVERQGHVLHRRSGEARSKIFGPSAGRIHVEAAVRRHQRPHRSPESEGRGHRDDVPAHSLQRVDPELRMAKSPSADDILAVARDADAILVTYAKLPGELLRQLTRCKAIGRFGLGVDNIDIKSAAELGIMVTYVPDYCMHEVSDHAMALLLALARKIPLSNKLVQAGRWEMPAVVPIHRLAGRVLGLVGFGNIPRAVAPKAKAFGLRVVTYDPYVSQEVLAAAGVEAVTFDRLLGISDFVSIHAPLMPATRGLFNAETFRKMKRGAALINTARGPLVDEDALVAALDSGQLGAAALDVVAVEPLPKDAKLIGRDNVILTPHTGFYSVEALDELQTKCAADVARVLSGEKPIYPVKAA